VKRRAGFSLPEVLVASAVLAVVTVPLMTSFLSSVGGASQDAREVRAAVLAQEVLEQVVALHRTMRTMMPVPSESSQKTGSDTELDLDAVLTAAKGEVGASLYTGRGWRQLSRLNLSPPRDGFRRYLAITFEEVGKDRGGRLTAASLFRVTARVRYTTPLSAGVQSRDVKVSTLLFAEGGQVREEFP
jgi:prepilin-type N-terminal cleavage/methylation domain-containing protein